jgi:hypothetical protein
MWSLKTLAPQMELGRDGALLVPQPNANVSKWPRNIERDDSHKW